MKTKQLAKVDGQQVHALILETGDEAKSCIERFAREHGLTAAYLSGIGAFERVTLGYFDWEEKTYREIPLDEQVEVASLNGDIAIKDGEPQLHAHLVVGDSHGHAHAGHLIEGRVRSTLEVVLTETPAQLRKRVDTETGLALIAASG